MKKLISSLMIAVTLFTVMPAKKAEAGLIIMGGSSMAVRSIFCKGMSENACENKFGFYALPGVLLGFGVIFSGVVMAPVNAVLGASLIVLDADGTLPQDKLELSLSERYTFISDNEVIADLASAIKTKASSQKPVEGKIEVKLSPAEVKSILEPTGLLETNPEDVARLIKELN